MNSSINLSIGIVKNNLGWETILSQEGIEFSYLDDLHLINSAQFSAIIITKNTPQKSYPAILQYLKCGGIGLFESIKFCEIFSISMTTKKVKYLISNKDSIYAGIGLIDLEAKISIPNQKKWNYLDTELNIFDYNINKGKIIVLPFEVNSLVLDERSKRKKFYANRKELPSEVVSLVSKGKLREIVRISLQKLFEFRNLPFIQKNYFPEQYKSVFIFRVDTDFCNEIQATNLQSLCEKYKIKGSWFADTKQNVRFENVYAKMKSQEIGLHCYRHLVFNDYSENAKNFEKGMDVFRKCKMNPVGFVAPFGEWNQALGKVIEDFDFKFSSEFSLDYDNFPFYPIIDGEKSSVLQIPIHPISAGRLRRSHFSKNEMIDYYLKIIEEKLQKNEPIIIYHHPHHEMLEIFENLFRFIDSLDVKKMSMNDYYLWWQKRENTEIKARYYHNEIIFDKPKSNLFVRISYQGKQEIISMNKNINLQNIDWKSSSKPVFQKDIKRIRNFHWREILYNYESYRGRKRL